MPDIVKQVAPDSNHNKPTTSLVIRSAQQQTNGVDCGLFSNAFTTTLVFVEDWTTKIYDATLLRANLIKSFDNNSVVKFPVTEKIVIEGKPNTSTVEHYGACLMP